MSTFNPYFDAQRAKITDRAGKAGARSEPVDPEAALEDAHIPQWLVVDRSRPRLKLVRQHDA